MKYVAEARKALGIPTIFNLLGPLTNPGRAQHQLLGVFAPELTDRLAAVLRELGSARAWVVHADDGLDEISTLGPTRISESARGPHPHLDTRPEGIGIAYARLSDLQVETIEEAAEALTSVLQERPGPKRDIALLNAAAAMVIAEKAEDLKEGLEIRPANRWTTASRKSAGIADCRIETEIRLTAGPARGVCERCTSATAKRH